jgi:hypothetical protein
MEWLAPVAALVGVVIGGMLNAALAALGDSRTARRDALVGGRLLATELELARSLIRGSLATDRWGAVLDPGLPYSAGLWAVEHRGGSRQTSIWPDVRSALARSLSDDEWVTVARPFALIPAIGIGSWTDEPDRALSESDRDKLRALDAAIAQAILILQRFSGERGQSITPQPG